MRPILVVVHEPSECKHIKVLLEADGFEVQTALDAEDGSLLLAKSAFSVCIIGNAEASPDLTAFLRRTKRDNPDLAILLLTRSCVEADPAREQFELADAILPKPVELDRLRHVVGKLQQHSDLRRARLELSKKLSGAQGCHGLVGKTPGMCRVFELIELASRLDAPLLIQGEPGTGRQSVARAIHALGPRADRRMHTFTCIPGADSALEAALFGIESASLAGTQQRKVGVVEMADRSTLVLSDLAQMPAGVQNKVMTLLERREYERLGAARPTPAAVRVIALACAKLAEEVRAKRFRHDLFYRLAGFRIDIPTLRDRKEDIPLLVAHFLERYKGHSNPPVSSIDAEAMRALLAHDWPGNVAELDRTVRTAVALSVGKSINRTALPPALAQATVQGPSSEHDLVDVSRPLAEVKAEAVERVERAYLIDLLRRCDGQVAAAARQCGLSRRIVDSKMRKYGLHRSQFRGGFLFDEMRLV